VSVHEIPQPPYTAEDVARMLGKDPTTIRRAIDLKQFPGQRLGRNYAIPRTAFERWDRGEWKAAEASDFLKRRAS
jgi:excisionase family DNA binding protein